ncbi:OLC1v1000384C1 [Oldenlandia corymbosa var. corymbosa]|uniref:OLC1v1000384C1 n=1 Tax=Oldenlandia corymbosa var. corymbosa TaxID=529605 RepID=A0AAV1D685_OLDCO|nr:OLC1v1000384C1 [Oldenlandia corymbosa var. corymbosa]
MNCLRETFKNRIPLCTIHPLTAFFHSAPSRNILKIGQPLKLTRQFSDSDIAEYSKLSRDSNPLHFDPECAKLAGFDDRLVPGLLVATLFPRIIAAHFPGAVYASQTLQFKLPVYLGEEITGVVGATSIKEMRNKYVAKFSTKCFKNGDTLVIDGEATAVLPSNTIALEQQ